MLRAEGNYYIDDKGARFDRVTHVIKSVIRPDVRYKAGAAERGTWVHSATELADAGKLDLSSVPEEYMGYLAAYHAGMLHVMRNRDPFGAVEVEMPLSSKTLSIAGTIDRYYPDDGLLLDIKTGNVYEPDHALQLAGYTLLLEENGHSVKRWINLYLHADGTWRINDRKPAKEMLHNFRAVLRVFRMMH